MPCVASVWAQSQPAASGQPGRQDEATLQTRAFDIAAQPMMQAVLAFARQAGVDLYVGDVDLSSYTSVTTQGTYSLTAGLKHLLGNSPIGYRISEGNGRLSFQLIDNGPGGRSKVYSLKPVVVQGNTVNERVYQAPRAVSIITREEMDRVPVRHAAELIQDTPGVASAVNRQNPGLSINIRGMQDFGRVNMMIDGMRQDFVQNGHMQRNGEMYVDSELLSEVVVERGVVRGVHGTGAMAGSVDFRTLDFGDVLREGRDIGLRLRGTSGLGGQGNGMHFLGSAAGAARAGENLELLAAISRRSIGDYRIGSRGGNGQNRAWQNGGLAAFNDVKFASQAQDSSMFKARWKWDDAQSLQFSYTGTRVDYSYATDAYTSLQDNGTPWRGLGTSSVQSDSYALDYKLKPADNPWIDLNFKIYGVDTRNRNNADPVYPRGGVNGFRDPESIRQWIDLAWRMGYCERETVPETYASACAAGLGTDTRIATRTFGVQFDNTSRLFLGQGTSLSANYGMEYFSDRATSTVLLNHNGRPVDRFNPYGPGDTLNPHGRRSMGSIFADLKLEDDFYTVSVGLRYERYWLNGRTQVPGTSNTYQNRLSRLADHVCKSHPTDPKLYASYQKICEVALAGDEPAAAALWNEPYDAAIAANPRWKRIYEANKYEKSSRFKPKWDQESGLFDYDVNRSAGKVLPSIAGAIRPTDWLEVYGSWGKAWRPPAINESLMIGGHPGDNFAFMYPNPKAEPETSSTWELGANTIFRNVVSNGDRLAVKLGYFDTRAKNYLFTSAFNNLPGRNADASVDMGKTAFVNNRTGTRFRGLELEGRYDADWIYGGFSYTHYLGGPNKFCEDLYFLGSGTSVHDQPDENGNYPLAHREAVARGYKSWRAWADEQIVCGNLVFNSAIAKPVDKGMALIGFRLFERKLDTGVRFNYAGDGWYNRDAGGSQVWFKYTTWDWYASYQATPNVRLTASVENLTNRMYVEGYSDAMARTFAPGRTATLGMEVRF